MQRSTHVKSEKTLYQQHNDNNQKLFFVSHEIGNVLINSSPTGHHL